MSAVAFELDPSDRLPDGRLVLPWPIPVGQVVTVEIGGRRCRAEVRRTDPGRSIATEVRP